MSAGSLNAAAAMSRGGRAAAAAAVRRGVTAESSLRRPATITKAWPAWPGRGRDPEKGSRSAACSGSVQAGLETDKRPNPSYCFQTFGVFVCTHIWPLFGTSLGQQMDDGHGAV
jgi:hypothetical protein